MTDKTCSVCKTPKPPEDFYIDRSRPTGLTYACKPCHAQRVGTPESLARRRAADLLAKATPEGARLFFKYHLMARYRMSFEEWTELLVAQSGRCASCSMPMQKVCVDHDHGTGRVRGLLCNGCNRAEGLLDSDPIKAIALAAYMTRSMVGGTP